MGDPVVEVVFVEVGVHPNPFLAKNLVILRSRQWREQKKFQNVERQLPLDDLDVAQNRFLGVAGKTEDVARVGDGTMRARQLCSIDDSR